MPTRWWIVSCLRGDRQYWPLARSGPNELLADAQLRLLSLRRLREFTDQLVDDETLALRLVGADAQKPGAPVVSDAELFLLTLILDQAKAYELQSAPRLSDYLFNLGSMALGVAGIGMAFGPFPSVMSAIGAVIGVAGGVLSLVSGAVVIHKDIVVGERLAAIERASRIVRAAVEGDL